MSTNRAIAASAPVGKYMLEVGATAASSAQFPSACSKADRAQARANAAALRKALSAPDERTPVDGLETVEASARAVTDRVEHANDLFRAAAEDRLLDRDVLTSEIGSLLGLLERLDREGRYEEQIRVAKALHGLCVLAFRWLDLLRSLRSALSAAEAAGDRSAQAWALNELGALHLCVGAPAKAERYLEQALALQERVGDAAGRCTTRHNLDSARRDVARPVQLGAPRPLVRLLGVKAVLVVALLVLAAPPAVAWFAGRSGDGPLPPPSGPTPTGEATGPSGDGGSTPVALVLESPGEYLRGAAQLVATADDDVDVLVFQRAPEGGGNWMTFARDRQPPYEATLKTRPLPDGHYRLRAVAGSHRSDPIEVVIDNTPPTVALSDTGILAGTVELHARADDELSGLRDGSPSIEYSEQGAGRWATVPSPWATEGVADGSYDFRVVATDRAGNEAASPITTLWVDNDAPEVEITAPVEYVNADVYTVAATAAARDVRSVEFFRCADDSVSCTTGDWVSLGKDKARPFEVSWTVDADGNRALQAVAADRTHEASAVVDVVIDREAPIRGAIAADWDDKSGWVQLSVTPARDFGSGLPPEGGTVKRLTGAWITTGVAPYCSPDAEPATIVGTVPDSAPYVLTDSDVEGDRCYVYYYEATDRAGNVGLFGPDSVYVPGGG